MEALKSPAFYVGALGSRANNAKRRVRLARVRRDRRGDRATARPDRALHRQPHAAEIAVSILAEITAVKNGVELPEAARIAAAKEKLTASAACATS